MPTTTPASPADTREKCLDSPTLLRDGRWNGHFDLITGLAGIGAYALGRHTHSTAREVLTLTLDHLTAMVERRGGEASWPSPVPLLATWEREARPAGQRLYNLGVAHGNPGVLGLLAGFVSADIEVERARPLLAALSRWTLAHRGEPDVGFPNAVVSCGETPAGARLAWCYGDPGVAMTLLLAARALRDTELEASAVDVARRAALRDPGRSRVTDPALCHGASGVGHIFNRIHQATCDEAVGAAARYWFGRTLEMRRPGHGIGGFELRGTGTEPMDRDVSFLQGAVGVRLALLAAVTDTDPRWDQRILCSVGELPGRCAD